MKHLCYTLSIFLIAFACSKNADDPVAGPTSQTDFDISQIESKRYSFGDTVKADINVIPRVSAKELKINYTIYSSLNPKKTNGIAIGLPNYPANGDKPFVYKFRFPITDSRLAGAAGVQIFISTIYTTPTSNNAVGERVIDFFITFK